jgi:hypothetical protein
MYSKLSLSKDGHHVLLHRVGLKVSNSSFLSTNGVMTFINPPRDRYMMRYS